MSPISLFDWEDYTSLNKESEKKIKNTQENL